MSLPPPRIPQTRRVCESRDCNACKASQESDVGDVWAAAEQAMMCGGFHSQPDELNIYRQNRSLGESA